MLLSFFSQMWLSLWVRCCQEKGKITPGQAVALTYPCKDFHLSYSGRVLNYTRNTVFDVSWERRAPKGFYASSHPETWYKKFNLPPLHRDSRSSVSIQRSFWFKASESWLNPPLQDRHLGYKDPWAMCLNSVQLFFLQRTDSSAPLASSDIDKHLLTWMCSA